MNLIEEIIEFKSINDVSKGIKKNPGVAGYSLYSLKDTWVFPWKTKIKLNIQKAIGPNENIGIIVNTQDNNINITPKIIYIDNVKKWYVKARVKGLLPKKIHKETIVASMFIVNTRECYIVEDFT